MTDVANNEELATQQDIMSDLPAIPESQLDIAHSLRIPLDALPTLGTSFASLPDALRTTTTTLRTSTQDGELLYRVTDAAGQVISPEMLQSFRDGTGLLGSTRTDGTFAQARLHPVEAGEITQTATSVVPIDPTTMFMAAALMQVNMKLDAISDLQQEMFAYAKLRDHAKLVSACRVLDEIKSTYRFNSDNVQYLRTQGVAVAQAKRDSLTAIEVQRKLLTDRLSELGPLHTTLDVNKKTEEMVEALKDYQLASYLYAYTSVVDVILTGNFAPDYLEAVVTKMVDCADEYATLYKRCVGTIKKDSKKSIGARLARSLGKASSAAGDLVSSTVIGDLTPIDEALLAGAGALDTMVVEGAKRRKEALSVAEPGFTEPFIDSVRKIDLMHNKPALVAISNDAVYVVPAGSQEDGQAVDFSFTMSLDGQGAVKLAEGDLEQYQAAAEHAKENSVVSENFDSLQTNQSDFGQGSRLADLEEFSKRNTKKRWGRR